MPRVSERLVMEAIGALPITRIITAHRPGAVVAAGRTLLVAGGQVRSVQPKMVDAA